jgi:hypothetical protein
MGYSTLGDDALTVRQNCAIQNFNAACFFLFWQVIYTMPHAEEKLWQPMTAKGTTFWMGLSLFVLFGLANFIHAITFYHTLKNFLGGATSAGVMKGLQAVLVFLFTDWAFCGREVGSEMCFTRTKFLSLVTVVGGVVGYGFAPERKKEGYERKKEGYERISSEDQLVELLNSSPLPQTRKRSKDDVEI